MLYHDFTTIQTEMPCVWCGGTNTHSIIDRLLSFADWLHQAYQHNHYSTKTKQCQYESEVKIMPDAIFATRVELVSTEERLSAEIKENRENIVSNSKDIARLNTLYESLAGLPDAIVQLDKTLFKMGESINAMGEKVNSVNDTINAIKEAAKKRDERISKIDNKSKIDWQTMITDNFWKILSACLGVYVVIQLLITSVGGG